MELFTGRPFRFRCETGGHPPVSGSIAAGISRVRPEPVPLAQVTDTGSRTEKGYR
jgi:hypothetical protein